ncbi:MAG: DMT family transporter [Xanthomonadales bacterium]|nr:DMT family transporter [Xanthomonadales bacterium]
MGIGEGFALASALVWAMAVILLKRSGDTMGPFALNLFKHSLAVLLLIPTIWFCAGPFPRMETTELWLTMISGFLGIALADYCYLTALNLIGAGRTGIVSSLYSPCMIVLSYLFLDERLSLVQMGGFAAVMGGVLLVSRGSDTGMPPGQLRRGVALAALAVVLMALGIVMVKRILETHDFLWVVEIRLVAGTAGLLLMMILSGRTRRVLAQYREPHHWGQVITASVFSAYFATMLWLAGYKYAMASVASVLNETAGIFILIMATLFLREVMTLRKAGGVALTFFGVVLMVL